MEWKEHKEYIDQRIDEKYNTLKEYMDTKFNELSTKRIDDQEHVSEHYNSLNKKFDQISADYIKLNDSVGTLRENVAVVSSKMDDVKQVKENTIKLSNDIGVVLTEIKNLNENNKKRDDDLKTENSERDKKIGKLIDENNITLKKVISRAVTFILGLASAYIIFKFKGSP
jgi:uncharacterized phage infection (PIP) family protein YhgE